MWLFLAQEMLFFGGLFLGYTGCIGHYSEAFALREPTSSTVTLGAVNTAVLIGLVAHRGARVAPRSSARAAGIVMWLAATRRARATFRS